MKLWSSERDYVMGRLERITENAILDHNRIIEADGRLSLAINAQASEINNLTREIKRLTNHLQMLLLATGYEIYQVPEKPAVPAVPAHEDIRKVRK